MEHPISSLTFKGSISEAIVEAQTQKKLIVVYLSGENAESVDWETSTWTESNVTGALSKYCILLHISEGSTDAAHLSAIFPQKSAPCITVIGYNGLQLWQTEGFISAEVLASSLEKAWLGLHIQETTATFLTAALSSKESAPTTSGGDELASLEGGSSSGTDAPQSSTGRDILPVEARPLVTPEIMKENVKSEDTSSKSLSAIESEGGGGEHCISSTPTAEELLNPVTVDPEIPVVGPVPSSVEDRSPATEESINKTDHGSAVPERTSELTTEKVNGSTQDKVTEREDDKDALNIYSNVSKLNDVHLNIRLPDGTSLQKKFSVKSTLSMAKDCVDEHQSSGIGSYDLAIPYPRKVFNNQDLSKSFSDLGLVDRQALIVVPHQKAAAQLKLGSSSHSRADQVPGVDSLNESNGGYFAYVKRVLSFINPFSYLGDRASSSSSSQESQSSGWQYDPNPRMQSNLTETDRTYIPYSPNRNTSRSSRNDKSRQSNSSRFGSNIHTLHDEDNDDDERFNDKNAFWNGNSTQYGGNNNDK